MLTHVCITFRKVFFTGALFFSCASFIHAQTVSLGPRIGVNLSDLEGNGATGYSSTPGFTAGLAWNSTYERGLNLGGDVSFSRQGARVRDSDILTSHTRLNYLNATLLLKYYFWSDTRTTPILYVGPQVGYLLSASNTRTETPTDQFKRLDMSGAVGAALRISMERWWWTLDLRFAPGLTSIAKTGSTLRNSVLSLSSSFEFGSQVRKRRGLH